MVKVQTIIYSLFFRTGEIPKYLLETPWWTMLFMLDVYLIISPSLIARLYFIQLKHLFSHHLMVQICLNGV